MRTLLICVAWLSATMSAAGIAQSSSGNAAGATASMAVLLDNARVHVIRVFQTPSASVGVASRGAAVIVPLDDGANRKMGQAYWVADAAARDAIDGPGTFIIVQPKERAGSSAAPVTKPGMAPFTGMSFDPIFENDRVAVTRARMEESAREGVHTHAADTIVVHLTGGEIEDTADGKTVVNRPRRGDVEFESKGSSHSARNLGAPVDVVLVTLKP
jgi:quercetin dioxygenase-like cupin family protein